MKKGKYLYCVVSAEEKTSLGSIGVEDREVYTIPFQDIAAVVHSCDARPYDTSQEEKAKEWILAHLYTIDEATKRFGTPLPFRFDTIIKGGEDEVIEWLRKEHGRLKDVLEEVKGRAEYGVQIFWGRELADEIAESREIKELEGKSGGVAYMLRRRMEKMLKEEMAAEAEERRREVYERINACVAEIKVEKAKGKEMLLNLSCLADSRQAEELGKVLDEINATKGFSARFTGPWAPFNFTGGRA